MKLHQAGDDLAKAARRTQKDHTSALGTAMLIGSQAIQRLEELRRWPDRNPRETLPAEEPA